MNLSNKLISIKIDGASRLSKHYICVNAQYINEDKIQIVNLFMKEFNWRTTSQNLYTLILEILNQYNLSYKNIISLTIDNAANMVKLGTVINENVLNLLEADSSVICDESEISFEDLNLESFEFENNQFNVEEHVEIIRCASYTLQ